MQVSILHKIYLYTWVMQVSIIKCYNLLMPISDVSQQSLEAQQQQPILNTCSNWSAAQLPQCTVAQQLPHESLQCK